MQRTLTADIGKQEGKKVILMGWVGARRDHGKIIFIDLRDKSGLAQCVFTAKEKVLFSQADELRSEWVVKITGKVNKRPKDLINTELKSGKWEVLVENLEVLNKAETPPIAVDTDGREIGEESRLRYRYLDLRRPRMQKNMRSRHAINKLIRDYLSDQEFIEIETPIISKSTPEGARDFLVPSRIYPGKFYALPQAPQQYKQLLMVAGLEKYFQIARCFRDEDTRGDRQPEFTQLDLEMSFVEKEDVMGVIEGLFIEMVEKLFPHKKLTKKPFPRLKYADVIKKYKTDSPDLRKNKDDKDELAFAWVTNFPFFEKTKEDKWTFTHNPFSAPLKEHEQWLMEEKNIGKIITNQYDLVLNGQEVAGGSIRSHNPKVLKKVLQIIGVKNDQIKSNFGHMLAALGFGAPPHGGIAAGIDRLVAILNDEPNIREVIAFPKTGDARDLMMDAPSEASKEQLDELGLSIRHSERSEES
ncbi:MAG: aspartate--tRNA ligase [Patescibacteria group bacterium]